MAGIYFHIPFCSQACHYCNFHFSVNTSRKEQMIAAMRSELLHRREYLDGETVQSVYWGGGTPSLLPAESIGTLLQDARELFSVEAYAEITLEANPDDITPEKCHAWKAMGINRLSIGIQSLKDSALQWMNRSHTSQQALDSISIARAAGINNISIDLIYGIPELTDAEWEATLKRIIALDIQHISAYSLTVEPKTALDIYIRRKQASAPDEAAMESQFHMMTQLLKAAQYEHYEISNFCKAGYASQHNSSYWNGKKYLGIGPSAHSFNGHSRQWNIANNSLYMQTASDGIPTFEYEALSTHDQLNEYLMTGLRQSRGIDLKEIANRFGSAVADSVLSTIEGPAFSGNITLDGNSLRLTEKGKLLADGLISRLFQVE
ncbi:MAG: coproporphyrinogen III oxidase [Sphingobacteriales bacterium BACL12 MAG-120813-bin55]|jgi:oxygen-independent coproporphyrinogen III oxidase|nr:MAG: coproporphyrinogen III oxidase [Sphingobacteriales bacterium BACL12 MAG-120802-bin5]KRP11114.1 MAG: coproporphyrinogen III oxidase [Sphingobacteriales bacterium BACL12 MAG-120813-bin55]